MLHYLKLMRGKNSLKTNKNAVRGRLSKGRQKTLEVPPQSDKVEETSDNTEKSEIIIPGNKERRQNIMEDSSSADNSDSELSPTPPPAKEMSSQSKSVQPNKEILPLAATTTAARTKSSKNNEKLPGAEKNLKSKAGKTPIRENKSKNKRKDSSSLASETSSQEEENASSSPEKTWEDTLVVDPPAKEIADEPEFEVKFSTELAEDSYVCPSCSKEFSTKKKVIRHYKIHTEGRRYRCTRCDVRFMTMTDYKAHTNTFAHGNKKVFKCSDCSKGFTTKYLLKQHQNAHNGLLYRCQGCPKYYVYKRDFVRHVQCAHPELDPKDTNYVPLEIRQQGSNLIGNVQRSAKKLKGKQWKTKKGGKSANSATEILVDRQIQIEKSSQEAGKNSQQTQNKQNSQQTETKKKPGKSKSGSKSETDSSQKRNPNSPKKSNNKNKRLNEETGSSKIPLEDENDTESNSSFQLKLSKRRKMTGSKNSQNEISNAGNQDGENHQTSGDDDSLGDFIATKAKASSLSSNKNKKIVEEEEDEEEFEFQAGQGNNFGGGLTDEENQDEQDGKSGEEIKNHSEKDLKDGGLKGENQNQECPVCEKVLGSLVKLRKHLKKKHFMEST